MTLEVAGIVVAALTVVGSFINHEHDNSIDRADMVADMSGQSIQPEKVSVGTTQVRRTIRLDKELKKESEACVDVSNFRWEFPIHEGWTVTRESLSGIKVRIDGGDGPRSEVFRPDIGKESFVIRARIVNKGDCLRVLGLQLRSDETGLAAITGEYDEIRQSDE